MCYSMSSTIKNKSDRIKMYSMQVVHMPKFCAIYAVLVVTIVDNDDDDDNYNTEVTKDTKNIIYAATFDVYD